MKAGRGLDVLVAEKVMDFVVHQPEISSPGYLHIAEIGCELPFYSTSISAAWDVVEKMLSDMQGISIEQPFCDGNWRVLIYGRTERWMASSHSAPHTICLAALRAIETRSLVG